MNAQLEPLLELYARRRSARGFHPTPLDADTLHALFEAAQRAPSWCNVQPWQVVVTEPPATAALTAALVDAATQRPAETGAEVAFPSAYPSPYRERRRACGGALYQAMGIARDDEAGRHRAWLRNYQAFDAPHVAIVSCDRRLGAYAYVDVGVWLGYLLVAAESLGVGTCPMASLASYPAVLRRHLPIEEDSVILFGLALGTADPSCAANACRTARESSKSAIQVVSRLR
ncbi:MAG: nitroreductase [Kofleriaceae bacterium]